MVFRRGLWRRVLMAVPNIAHIEVATNEMAARTVAASNTSAALLVMGVKNPENNVKA